ncbi:putative membrane protein [Halapricum desulfuricans]|uniref:Putative membrane protein n=1 Tax=Halapricum desulfuricans TaxID=2841257 RepID=A0A897NI07_9EURY|nr:cyclin family protein [Halapricum desulfuricans]QSG12228.1 putative membrane protein [Halapricum desulfuricans]
MGRRRCHRRYGRVAGLLGLAVVATGSVAAHGAALGGGGREAVAVPTWLFLVTGGAAIGASFLLASLVTDRALIAAVHDWRRRVPVPGESLLGSVLSLAGVVGLLWVFVVGVVGPQRGASNAAVLLVWVGWWAGFTMSTYLVGSVWPTLNPWRTVADSLLSLDRLYPDRLGAWPSVVGLLALIWIEVVSPVAGDPRTLAAVVTGYTAVTLSGAIAYGPDRWFETVDPIARVFRYYGRLAPLSRESGSIRLRLPGTALAETRLVDGFDEVGFVIALVWATTYDGFVATPAWESAVAPIVEAGVPPLVLYLVVLVAGYLLFVGVYLLGTRYSRQLAGTYLSTATLARRFASPLLAIAAGYHLAHYLEYFLSLAPSLIATAATPLALRETVPVLALPGWFDAVALTSVLLGHVLAIWTAHAVAFNSFPGRLQAIRSQYPYTVVMVLYTISSLFIVSQPTIEPPFL